MITEKKDGCVLPVLILNRDSTIIGAGITNKKGYRKSIERTEAWLLDGESGKLLPDPRVKGFKSIVQKDLYVEMRAEGFEPLEALQKEVVQKPINSQRLAEENDSYSSLKDTGAILAEVEQLIFERKHAMPKGSYTTYLFEQGEEKIRKKVGEEAVELILAQSKDEMASEAADLLYHVMVLFVERGIGLNDALRILHKRR